MGSGPDFEYGTAAGQEFEFRACDGCSTWYLDPRPADAEIAGLYPDDYEPYRFDQLPRVVRMGRDFVQRGKARLAAGLVVNGGCVVDVGAGNGQFLRAMRALPGSARWRLVGWDFPGPALDRLASEGFDVVAGPIVPGVAPDRIDLAVMLQVIEHVPRPREVIETLAGSTPAGGYLYIETPSIDGLDARLFRGRYWGGYHFPRHMVLFSESSLKRLLEECGYEVMRVEYLASTAFWIQSVHHMLSERRVLSRLQGVATLRNPMAVAAVVGWEALWRQFRPTSNMRIVARRC